MKFILLSSPAMKRFISMIMAVLIILTKHSSVVRSQLFHHSCAANGSYTSNTTYIATLLNSLPSNMSNYGFYASSVATAHALALCRADTSLDQCRRCVQAAADAMLLACRNQRRGFGWYDSSCLVQYSDDTSFSVVRDRPIILYDEKTRNMSAGDDYFREDVTRLLADLRLEAAKGSSELKVAAGTRRTTEVETPTIYAVAQCTPDLSFHDCRSCLDYIVDEMVRENDNSRAMTLLASSCIIRHDLYTFYNETRLRELGLPLLPISPPPPSPTDSSRGKKDKDTTKIVAIIVPIGVCLALVSACALISLRKTVKRPRSLEMTESGLAFDEISSVESLQYDLGQIRAATSDFSDANMLGQGGFGTVYRGRLRQNGQEIAVKRLSKNSDQGNTEFKNEVLLVARLQHRNLVKLLGFSLQGTERLLVYEFVQNASLDKFIFDVRKRSWLDWDTRHKIIGAVARGILYLHEDSRLRIIHRDLKASNILLDGDMNPKIADFGMARLTRHDDTQGNTRKIVGTYGYMAPEYAMHGKFSTKSDVFSFGVLILEIISGKRNNYTRRGDNVEDLLTLIWENWQKGTAENTIDPLLKNSRSSLPEMVKCIHIGLLCVQESANNRPPMTSVLHMLNTSASTFPLPSEPAFYIPDASLAARVAVEMADFNANASPPPPSATSKVAAPPHSPLASCDAKKCPWWPYTSSNDFKANTALIIVVLFCALICALAFNAAIRYIVRLHCLRRRRDDGEDQKPGHGGGATEEDAEIPALIYAEGMKLAGAETECIICLSEFSVGEKIRVLQKCNHGFHLHCVQKWLVSHSSCPTCRTNCSTESATSLP